MKKYSKTYIEYFDCLPENLRRIRKENGLTQEQLAEKAGCKRDTINKIENNNRIPEFETIINICKVLGCSVDSLTGHDACKTHDVQGVHDYTGLSEKAIEIMHSKDFDIWKAQLLSMLLTESNILDRISDYWHLTKTSLDFVQLEYTERKIVDHEIVDDSIRKKVYVRTDMKVNDSAIGEMTFKEAALRLIQDELEKVIGKH